MDFISDKGPGSYQGQARLVFLQHRNTVEGSVWGKMRANAGVTQQAPPLCDLHINLSVLVRRSMQSESRAPTLCA